MENLEEHIKFKYDQKLTKGPHISVKQTLNNINGVNHVAEDPDGLTVSYNPYSLSDSILIQEMKKMGFLTVEEAESKKGFIARWLDKMAKINKKNFGDKPLDCCELKEKQNKV
ncbi:MAG: hypothetical protein K9I29_09175 [Bacteroidales bacterium]|nr:hypothetical protein [Bacteroidales bacterium]MCF8328449.1 hypothetical protein [Bacteroidales bacterium]